MTTPQTATRYWVVCYSYEVKPGLKTNSGQPIEAGPPRVTNTLVAGEHPVLWLSRPREDYDKYYIKALLWYSEIDEETYNEAKRLNYIGE